MCYGLRCVARGHAREKKARLTRRKKIVLDGVPRTWTLSTRANDK